jgi:hypothetical protein
MISEHVWKKKSLIPKKKKVTFFLKKLDSVKDYFTDLNLCLGILNQISNFKISKLMKIKLFLVIVFATFLTSTQLVQAQGWCGWSNLFKNCMPITTSDGLCAVSMPSCEGPVVEGERDQ